MIYSPELRYRLEHIFANDFQSPVFTMLADLYYKNKEYRRSFKVCEIGLKNNPNNMFGQFILAKLYINQNKLNKAESILKKVIIQDPANILALTTFIKLEYQLKRSENTIKKYIYMAFHITPNNNKIKKLYKKLFTVKEKQKTIYDIPKKKEKKLLIDKKMTTKTMYQLMSKQQKYQIAFKILKAMEKANKNKKFVDIEMKKMKKHLNKGK